MEIIYRAFDGTEFDDAHGCREYEIKLNIEQTIDKFGSPLFFDKEGNEITYEHSLLSQKMYSLCDKIVVTDIQQVRILKDVYDFCGFKYDSITETGTWIYCNEKSDFIRIDGE